MHGTRWIAAVRITITLRDVEVEDDVCTACRQSIHGSFLELMIQDTGRGIAPEVVDRMFEPFFTTKEVGKGSGMGLSTVHGIVHEHGGHIVVQTTPGEGTAFKVLFPALTDLERVEDSESAQAKATARDLGIKAHIMVVDDEASVAEFMDRLELLMGKPVRAVLRGLVGSNSDWLSGVLFSNGRLYPELHPIVWGVPSLLKTIYMGNSQHVRIHTVTPNHSG